MPIGIGNVHRLLMAEGVSNPLRCLIDIARVMHANSHVIVVTEQEQIGWFLNVTGTDIVNQRAVNAIVRKPEFPVTGIGDVGELFRTLVTCWIAWSVIGGLFGGIRVSEQEEIQGLDIGEHGMEAYPDFASTK